MNTVVAFYRQQMGYGKQKSINLGPKTDDITRFDQFFRRRCGKELRCGSETAQGAFQRQLAGYHSTDTQSCGPITAHILGQVL